MSKPPKKIKYKLKDGTPVERMSSGPSAHTIHTDPRYVIVDRNGYELGGASVLAASILQPLKSSTATFTETYIHGKLSGLCRKIIMLQPEDLNPRTATLTSHGKLLHGFPFNHKLPFAYVCNTSFVCSTTPQRDQITFSATCQTYQLSRYKKSTTHYQFHYALVTVSQHQFNKQQEKYLPTHPAQNALVSTSTSQLIPITQESTPLSTTLTIPTSEPLSPTTAIVCVIGIEFYKQEGHTIVPLKTAAAMKIHTIL